MPVEYGGGGGDFLYDAIVIEEIARRRAHGLMTAVHSSICMPYVLAYGSEAQKQRWLPPAIRGECLLGICMTEPGTGSDLANIQQERIAIAVSALASCRRSLDDTVAYVRQRYAFGQPIAAFQNTQFTLAELATQVEIGEAFVDKVLAGHVRGEDVVQEASMAKWWTTDLQKRLTGECVQLHGGYGFMTEYPIATDYADAAVQSIYAGTNEIMKVIIARRMGLG